MTIYQRVLLFLSGLMVLWPLASHAELPDPTRPWDVEANALVVSAILISPERRIAIIDGHIVHVGDRLAEGDVIAIEPNRVELNGINGKLTLRLVHQPVKQ